VRRGNISSFQFSRFLSDCSSYRWTLDAWEQREKKERRGKNGTCAAFHMIGFYDVLGSPTLAIGGRGKVSITQDTGKRKKGGKRDMFEL